MSEYHKIHSLFKRDEKTSRLIPGAWINPEFEYLKDLPWDWTEKIDGTNVRVIVDQLSQNVRFAGKTDRANMPPRLIEHLSNTFPADPLLELFPQGAVLYGEGYGGKIQSPVGQQYLPDRHSFVLFDVRVGDLFLRRVDVDGIAKNLGVDSVPQVGLGSLQSAIEAVTRGFRSVYGTAWAEGLVVRPCVELKSRNGSRIIAKIKARDFQ